VYHISDPHFDDAGVQDIKAHWDSKHSKLPFDEAKYIEAFNINKQATKDAVDVRQEKRKELGRDSKRI